MHLSDTILLSPLPVKVAASMRAIALETWLPSWRAPAVGFAGFLSTQVSLLLSSTILGGRSWRTARILSYLQVERKTCSQTMRSPGQDIG